jgi:NAD(P)H-dependent FMN reductase
LPRIAVIVGNNRRDSINRKLAQSLVRLGAGKFEATFARIDDLPMYNQDNEGHLPPEVVRFKNEIAQTDGVLIVTQEHDRSIPAVLKNAIDWGARPWGKSSWPGKPAHHRHLGRRDRQRIGAAAFAFRDDRPRHDPARRRGLCHVQAGSDR